MQGSSLASRSALSHVSSVDTELTIEDLEGEESGHASEEVLSAFSKASLSPIRLRQCQYLGHISCLPIHLFVLTVEPCNKMDRSELHR